MMRRRLGLLPPTTRTGHGKNHWWSSDRQLRDRIQRELCRGREATRCRDRACAAQRRPQHISESVPKTMHQCGRVMRSVVPLVEQPS